MNLIWPNDQLILVRTKIRQKFIKTFSAKIVFFFAKNKTGQELILKAFIHSWLLEQYGMFSYCI